MTAQRGWGGGTLYEPVNDEPPALRRGRYRLAVISSHRTVRINILRWGHCLTC